MAYNTAESAVAQQKNVADIADKLLDKIQATASPTTPPPPPPQPDISTMLNALNDAIHGAQQPALPAVVPAPAVVQAPSGDVHTVVAQTASMPSLVADLRRVLADPVPPVPPLEGDVQATAGTARGNVTAATSRPGADEILATNGLLR